MLSNESQTNYLFASLVTVHMNLPAHASTCAYYLCAHASLVCGLQVAHESLAHDTLECVNLLVSGKMYVVLRVY